MAVNLVAEGGRGPRPPCLPAWLLYYATLCMSLHSIRVAACESMAAGPVGCQRHCSNQASSAAPSCAPTGAAVTEGCHSSHLCVPVFTGEWSGWSFSFNFYFYFIFFSTLIMTSSPTVMMSLQLLLLFKRWTPLPILLPHHYLLCSLSTGPPSAGYLCSVIGSFSHFSVWRWRQETQREGEAGVWRKETKRLQGKGYILRTCVRVPWADTSDVI